MNLSRGSRLVVLAVLLSESLHDGMHLRGVSSGVVGLEYLVHGFETDVARLGKDPYGVCDTKKHECEEEKVCAICDILEHRRDHEGYTEVEHPVGRSGEGGTGSSRRHGHDFSNHSPGDGAPGVTKIEAVNPDEDSRGPCGTGMGGP